MVFAYDTCMCIGGVVYMEWNNCVLVSGVWYIITLVFLKTVDI